MKRFSACMLALALMLPMASWAGSAENLLSESALAVHGLKRAWAVQMDMDSSRSRLKDILVDRGALFAQTDRAVVQAFDAETGRPLWASAKQVGNPNRPTVPMGANEKLLAVVNGNRLFVLNRFTGETLLEKSIEEGAPSAGLAVSDRRVYVPMTTGLIIAYRIKPLVDPLKELGKTKKGPAETTDAQLVDDFRLSQDYIPPLACQSLGRSFVNPVIIRQTDEEEYVAWPTDRGMMCVGRIDRTAEDAFAVKYRLEAGREIAVPALYLPSERSASEPGVVITASCDGYVYALNDKSGTSMWRFPAGEPVVQPMALIAGNLYVPTQLGGLYCLEARTGKQKWWAPQIAEFLAASKDRIYGADKTGQMQILDQKSGSRIDTMSIAAFPLRECNLQSDRVYLADTSGLIQCLHEPQQTQPLSWIVEPKKAEKAEKAEKKPPKPKPEGDGEKKPPVEKKPVEKKPPPEKKPVEKKPLPEKKPLRGKKGAEAPAGNANPFGAKP